MSGTAPDFPRLLNRLSHMVALTKSGRTDSAVDHLTLALFVVDPLFAPRVASEIATAARSQFRTSLSRHVIEQSLTRLGRAGKLTRESGTGKYRIAPPAKAEIDEAINGAEALEQEVRGEWMEQLEGAHPDLAVGAYTEMWQCLMRYMAYAFERHGVEAVQLLEPRSGDANPGPASLANFLAQAIDETCSVAPPVIAQAEIPRFFAGPTSRRTRYVAQLLDATFAVFALSVDETTSTYLRESLPAVRAVGDTNLLFDLLSLNVTPYSDVSRELVQTIRENKLPFQLYYHEATFDETRNTIASMGEKLRDQQWQQALSPVALRTLDLNGLERRYHEINAATPTDAADYLSIYDHLEELLRDWGFEIYQPFVGHKVVVGVHRHPRVVDCLNHPGHVVPRLRLGAILVQSPKGIDKLVSRERGRRAARGVADVEHAEVGAAAEVDEGVVFPVAGLPQPGIAAEKRILFLIIC